jgi:hypothetical protein
MSIFDPGFWPWFWAVILSGAIMTAALCLVAASVMTRRADRRGADAGARDRLPESAAHDRAPKSVAHDHHPLVLR